MEDKVHESNRIRIKRRLAIDEYLLEKEIPPERDNERNQQPGRGKEAVGTETEFHEKLPGGWGMMADDIAAGLLTAILLILLNLFILP